MLNFRFPKTPSIRMSNYEHFIHHKLFNAFVNFTRSGYFPAFKNENDFKKNCGWSYTMESHRDMSLTEGTILHTVVGNIKIPIRALTDQLLIDKGRR